MKPIHRPAPILSGAILIACILLAGFASTAQAVTNPQPGVDDNFYKIIVPQTGIYQVTYEDLRDAGLPVDSMTPSTLRLFEQGVEIARTIVDNVPMDVFNAGDYLLFYGQVADTEFVLANTYWLTYNRGQGLDMSTRDGTPDAGLPGVTSFQATLHLEQNRTFRSELPLTGYADRWYLQSYQPSCRLVTGQPSLKRCTPYFFNFPVDIPEVATGVYSATLSPRLRGVAATTSTPEHTATFYMNGTQLGTANFWLDAESLVAFSFDQSLLVAGANIFSFTVPITSATMHKDTPIDQGFINWFEIGYQRTYTLPATGQFPFNVDATTPVSLTLLGAADAATVIYDISDPQIPVLITGVAAMPAAASRLAAPAAFNLSFAHQLTAPAEYRAVGSSQYLSPASIVADVPSNLRDTAHAADWIIITHADFLPAAQTLAAHRRDFQRLRTEIVDVQQIYDEFNGGLVDQEAIRTFIRYAYENWKRPAPLYVVLMGDGHYDPRCYVCTAPSYIPPYLYAVDRFIGVTAADNRYVAYDPVPPEINPPPFMNLGRLPANNPDDADAIINKIITYETGAITDSSWLTKTVFVADDPDYAGNFWAYSTRIVTDTALLPAEYSREQIYLATGGNVDTATAQLVRAINSGALLVNFNGHASYTGWAFEGLWELADTAALTNTGKYPIMLPMTCLDGYYIYPFGTMAESIGEKIVRVPNAGAVASFSPTGKGVAQGHDVLSQALYDAIFADDVTEIGRATTIAKHSLAASSSQYKELIDTYILFGDPAMSVRMQELDLWVQKQAEPDGPWLPGQAITYHLTYGNAGALLATSVVLTDILPASLTNFSWTSSDPQVQEVAGETYVWRLPDLAPGVTGTITLNASVRVGAALGATITNTATISGLNEPLNRLANNTDRAATPTVLPTGFDLEYLRSRREGMGFRIEWATRLELDIVGFNVYRTDNLGGVGTLMNAALISATAPPGGGAAYSIFDPKPAKFGTIYHRLEVIDASGNSFFFGPVSVSVRGTYLPLIQKRR